MKQTFLFVVPSPMYTGKKVHIVFVLVLDYHVNMDETRLCWERSFGRVHFSHIFRTKHENHLAFDQIIPGNGENTVLYS